MRAATAHNFAVCPLVVAGGYEYKMDGLSSNIRRRPLQVAVAGLLSEVGYEHVEKMAHETLIEAVQSSKFRWCAVCVIFWFIAVACICKDDQ
jgi:adenine deaminase